MGRTSSPCRTFLVGFSGSHGAGPRRSLCVWGRGDDYADLFRQTDADRPDTYHRPPQTFGELCHRARHVRISLTTCAPPPPYFTTFVSTVFVVTPSFPLSPSPLSCFPVVNTVASTSKAAKNLSIRLIPRTVCRPARWQRLQMLSRQAHSNVPLFPKTDRKRSNSGHCIARPSRSKLVNQRPGVTKS